MKWKEPTLLELRMIALYRRDQPPRQVRHRMVLRPVAIYTIEGVH